jgi:CMP-N-acetylneuraminic acid synthetase
MVRPFAQSSLFQICVEKLLTSRVFDSNDIIIAHDKDEPKFLDILEQVRTNIGKYFNFYERSIESCNEDEDQTKIYEFYQFAQDLGYEYCILINPCCPLLRIETIDAFYSTFKYLEKDGLFGVLKKQNYLWYHDKRSINLPSGGGIMNTKNPACTIYEAAHCLYGSKLSLIPEKKWMGGFSNGSPELFIIPENEAYDIDYEWQLKYVEILYKNLK